MKKTALLLIVFTILSKIFGFLKDIVLSYYYGVSNLSDIFLISLTIPVGIFAFVGAGISTGYIPMYSKIEKEEGLEIGNRYTNNLINIIMIICTIIIVLGFIFTSQIVKAFASGFEGETLKIAITFTRISLWGIYAMGLLYVFNGFLQLKNDYIAPSLTLVPLNFLTILAIIISYKTNITVLAIGSLIATFSQILLLIPFIQKKGYKYCFIVDIKDKYIVNMAYIAIPVIIGASVNQINVLVDRTIASNMIVGGISALTYANKINQFVQGVFVLSIATVLYPTISKMVAENNIKGLKKSTSEAIVVINLLLIPASIGVMILAEPIVTLLFGRGAFDSQAIILTSSTLFYYSIGMIGFGLREILSRTFYSMQDTKTPMINAVIGMALNIILNIILSRYLGIGGLALATSVAAIFTTGLLFISLRKKIGPFGMKQICMSVIKILSASLLMGLFVKLSFDHLILTLSQNLSLLITIVIGAVSYFIIIYFMKIEDVNVIISSIKKKLNL